MYGSGAFRNVEDLRQWFFRNKAPFWSLYMGRDTDRKNRIAANVEERDIDNSWNWLQEIIVAQNGGMFHIHAKSSPNEDADRPTLKEKAAQRITSAGFHALFELVPSTIANQQKNNSGIQGLYPYVGNNDLKSIIEEEVQKRIDVYERDMEIAGLAEEIKELKKGGKILGFTAGQIPELLMMVKSIFGSNHPNGPQVQTLGISGVPSAKEKFDDFQNHKTQPSEMQPSEIKESDMQDLDMSEEEIDRVNDCLIRLKQHFPKLVESLETLTRKVEENPVMFQFLLNEQNNNG